MERCLHAVPRVDLTHGALEHGRQERESECIHLEKVAFDETRVEGDRRDLGVPFGHLSGKEQVRELGLGIGRPSI